MANLDFDRESGTLLLPLEKAAVGLGDEPVRFDGRRFQPKREVHITLIGKDLGEAVVEAAAQDERVFDRLQQAARAVDWGYQLTDAWYHVAEGEPGGGQAETIIRMADVPGLAEFYRRLGEILGRALEVPPAHVTLYTRNTSEGIGLADAAAFRRHVVAAVEPRAWE